MYSYLAFSQHFQLSQQKLKKGHVMKFIVADREKLMEYTWLHNYSKKLNQKLERRINSLL